MPTSESPQQLPLFSQTPQRAEDITRQTPLQATIELFAAHLTAEGKSDYTVVAFTADLELLGEYHGKRTPVGDFTTEDLNAFLHWLEVGRGVSCSPKSYARRVTSLKVYFKWLKAIHAVRQDPAEAVLQRSQQAPLSEVLTPDQTQLCLAMARTFTYKRSQDADTRPPMLLRLLLDSGIKKNETMTLTAEHLMLDDPQNPTLTVRYKVRNVFKERNITLDVGWVPLYEAYVRQYAPETVLFDCTARNLEYVLSHIGEKAELPFKLSFEICRWTSALRDLRAGIPEDDIRQKLGLSEISWYETGNKLRELSAQLDRRG
jgi:integrase/recombinase XerD